MNEYPPSIHKVCMKGIQEYSRNYLSISRNETEGRPPPPQIKLKMDTRKKLQEYLDMQEAISVTEICKDHRNLVPKRVMFHITICPLQIAGLGGWVGSIKRTYRFPRPEVSRIV